jgi:hypothetical protein
MDDAPGQAEGMGLRVAFDRRLKLEFHGATVTSDAGCSRFANSTTLWASRRWRPRSSPTRAPGETVARSLIAQFRQAVFGRLAGYEDVNVAGPPRSRSAASSPFTR